MRAALALGGLAALSAAAPVAASPRQFAVPICIEDVREIPVWLREIPIPVGCEIIDCCPGCPGPGPLDWQVRVGGAPLASVGVRFERLAPGQPIKLEGDARPTADGALIGPRGATLGNLGGVRDQVPMASLELGLDDAVLEKLAQGPGGTDQDLGEIDVAIDQRLGPVIVNEFRYKAVLRHCKVAPIEPCDQVVQLDNRGGDRSVLQLDGRRSAGCTEDELHRSDAVTKLGNVLSPDASCPSGELAVYSKGDAMWLRTAAGFTDTCGDRIEARLDPVLRAPVSVWRAQTSFQRDPALDLANADSNFDDWNKVGVIFDAKTTDLSGNRAATTAALAWCVGLPALRLAGFYDPGRLNVYYSDFPTTGTLCPLDSNAIFVGTWANLATLAHEFGHAFALQHTENLTGFTPQNLMNGGGPPTRDHISLGQAFRVNVDTRSQLNVNGVRSGHSRPCPASGGDCPKLELDWSRP